MPRLNRDLIREWLLDNDKSVRWLAERADIPRSVLANALCPSADQIRGGRVRALSRVLGLAPDDLVAEEEKDGGEEDGPKEEPTAPPRRADKSKGPKRARGVAA